MNSNNLSNHIQQFYKYALAVAFAVTALGVSFIFWDIIEDAPFLFFIAAVALAAWQGGLGPGIVGAGIAIILADYFLIEPTYSFAASTRDYFQFIIFSSVAVLISWLQHRNQVIARRLSERKIESERLAAIVHSSNDAIISKDLDGRIVSWNPAAERLYGYLQGEAIGQPISILFPGDIEATEMNLLPKIRAGQPIEHYETKRLTKNGDTIDISLTISAIHDETGQVIGYSTVERDITQQKQTEQSMFQLTLMLGQQRQRVNNLVANVPGVVYDSVLMEAGGQQMNFISDFATEMFGYQQQNWLDDPYFFEKLVHPDDWELTVKKAAQTLQNDEPGYAQFRCTHADGSILWVDSYYRFERDGDQIKSYGVMMDVTKRKQREQEIKDLNRKIAAERRRLRDIVANVPGIVYESEGDPADGHQTMTFYSPYIEPMLGYTVEEAFAEDNLFEKIIHPEDWNQTMAEAARIFEAATASTIEFRCITKEGELKHVRSHITVVTDEHEQPHGFVGVIMDVTDQKLAEEALEAYMHELQRSNEELEQFAYVASHDLQEPLRKVISYLQLVEKRYTDKLDQDGKEFIDYAVDGASRMKALINDLLTYSRVQRNRGDFKDVAVQDIIEQVINNLQLTIEDNNALVTTDELPTVRGSSRQIIQLFQNLISNAIKFRREERPEVHISARKVARGWQFCVRDNGIGIEEDYMERIFVIFQRLHGRGKHPGTGIGLAICRKVVENHGGRIWVESEPGQGTTFYFTIDAPRERIVLKHARN